MKLHLPHFLTAHRLSVLAVLALTAALIVGAPFLLPRLATLEVRADSNSDPVQGRSVDFEPQSRHWAPAYNHSARKPAAGKLKHPRAMSPAPPAVSADN